MSDEQRNEEINTVESDKSVHEQLKEAKQQLETVPEASEEPEQKGVEKGQVVLENGTKLLYKHVQRSNLFIDKLSDLERTFKRANPLPTQVLFPHQGEEEMNLIEDYVEGIKRNVQCVHQFGMKEDIDSYSFRCPHFIRYDEWINVVVRLQFATALHVIKDTLNANLEPTAKHQWGVLTLSPLGDKYLINGEEIKCGQHVDIFTTKEKIITNAIFGDHSAVNCQVMEGGISAPIVYLPIDELDELLGTEETEERASAAIGEKEHLLGVDAWSFLNILLYRIREDEVEILDIQTDVLTKHDRDPSIPAKDYEADLQFIVDNPLPFGLDNNVITAIQSYYSKKDRLYYAFIQNVVDLINNPNEFRKRVEIGLNGKVLLGMVDLLQYLAGTKSKLLRFDVVMFDGSVKSVVATDRSFSMVSWVSFNRYNPHEVKFVEIDFKPQPDTRSFVQRLIGKPIPINPHEFDVTATVIDSTDVIAIVQDSVFAYYFNEDSTFENDIHFKQYYDVKHVLRGPVGDAVNGKY